ncbi:MAG: 50S ribosomal protein L18 [Methanomassiliicoccales archaeon]
MLQGPRYKVEFRRRREGRTDYSHRLKLLRSGMPRATVRRSNKYYSVQLIEFDAGGDIVIAAASSKELVKYGWAGAASNVAAAYLTGLLAGKRAKIKGISTAVLDAGILSPKKASGVYAALKGLLDAGVDVPHSDDVLTPMERIANVAGKHGEFENIKRRVTG